MNRLHDSPYLMNSFLSGFPELVVRHGGHLPSLCEAVDLPVEAVTQRHRLIPFDKFIGLLEVAADRFDYPEIAFDLASRQTLETLGPVSLLVEGCETFGAALQRILDYFDILTSGFRIELKTEGELLVLVFHIGMPGLEGRRQFQNYLLASCVSAIRNLMGEKFPIRGCYFTREEQDPSQQQKYADFFCCPVAFGSEAIRLVFNKGIMSAPVKAETFRKPGLMLGFRDAEDLNAQLEAIVPLYLASGTASLATIARAMGYSTGTFRRRLKDASISFSDTLSAVRLSLANQYLESTHYSMGDIAALLGYRHQSAFTRSYTAWCGITPSQYRQNLKPASRKMPGS